ncbi:squalene-hopene cyclase [Bryobacterales bacterium F-183]|nr:squalene-hopene cyclase [Bryobacterales bacterium F-183]
MSSGFQVTESVLARLGTAERKAADALLRMQTPEGYWWAELTADSTLESDWILLQLWMQPPDADGVWRPRNRAQIERAIGSILRRQNADGGFSIYHGGPSEISASVKAYFALKLWGQNPSELAKLRECIYSLGGLQAANSYTKINLGLFGLYPREHTPTVPPELILAGKLIYDMSSWSRAIVVPLAIVQSANPNRPVPKGFTLEELLIPGKAMGQAIDAGWLSWRGFFERLDGYLKLWERRGLKGIRQKAIQRCEAWMLAHTRKSDGVAAIYPPMMYTIMALDVLGYAPDHPHQVEARTQFDRLMVDRPDTGEFYFQPCFSVVWDTAIAAFAVGESGAGPASSMQRCGDWLLTKEVREKGDWSVKRPNLEPSGWYFEFANEFYPDIDDTAMVLLALEHAKARDEVAWNATRKRAVNWLLGMQSRDGGWAAFDVDNNRNALTHVPFADHNAMLDPTCPDITGRVLEALARFRGHDDPAIRRGIDYLINTQTSEGSWYGRWGVGYVYGTCFALRGLQAAGESDREAHVLRGGEWLRSIQNADGGWGESCASYDKNGFVAGPSTASQTAWAVMGLVAGGDTTSGSVRKGIEYLCDTQKADGTWDEPYATGTGFPRVFYLNYHLYRNSFPLLALAAYRKAQNGES